MIDLISQEKAKKLFEKELEKAESFQLILGEPYPLLILDDIEFGFSGEVGWEVYEDGTFLHFFLKTELESESYTIGPFCLVDPESRERISVLLNTTRGREDSRLNKRDAQFSISDPKGFALKVNCPLPGMASSFVASKMIPGEILKEYSLKECPHCGGSRNE